ncbi:MAG: TetR/AcrR family transcriptional regulator [Acidobacteria bacterium]|nr:TetR/AcrR family transcriptional regulator [Acidobacteriota bacterium]
MLIDCAIAELEEKGYDAFNIDAVLERSRASRSSLYHHYGSRAGLLAAAVLHDIEAKSTRDNADFRDAIVRCVTRDDLKSIVERAVKGSGSASRRSLRLARTRAYQLAEHDEGIAARIALLTKTESAKLADSLFDLQERDLIRRDVDAAVLALWIGSVFYGRVAFDFTNATPSQSRAWELITIDSLMAMLSGLKVR